MRGQDIFILFMIDEECKDKLFMGCYSSYKNALREIQMDFYGGVVPKDLSEFDKASKDKLLPGDVHEITVKGLPTFIIYKGSMNKSMSFLSVCKENKKQNHKVQSSSLKIFDELESTYKKSKKKLDEIEKLYSEAKKIVERILEPEGSKKGRRKSK